MQTDEQRGQDTDRRRRTIYFVALAVFVVIGLTLAFAIGSEREAEESYSGRYEAQPMSDCLGRSFDLRQSGQFASIASPDGEVGGSLRVDDGRITGDVECLDSSERKADLEATSFSIAGRLGKEPLSARRTADAPPPEAGSSLQPANVEGAYDLAPLSICLGSSFEISGRDEAVVVDGSAEVSGTWSYESGRITGDVRCLDGSRVLIEGQATERTIQLELTPAAGSPRRAEAERIEATETRDLAATVAAFLLALIVIVIVARSFGAAAVRFKQPRVMGEVVAGLVLGPSVLGALAPELTKALFPSDLIVTLGVFANVGVLFYMFIIGAEVNLWQMRQRLGLAVAVASGSLAIPVVLGVAIAVPAYELVAPDVGFTEFALFMGVAMSITAFPVLARILAERNLLNRPTGAAALAAAAIGDVCAWFLIALATAFATSGEGGDVASTIVLAAVFCVVMVGVVRPLLTKAFARVGGTRLSPAWLSVVLVATLTAAYVSETIGVAVIFGAFLMGLVMPRTMLTDDAVRRIEDFVVLLLLPLFFAYTGLRTDVGSLNDPALWILAGALLAVAIVGKFAGAMIGARVWRVDLRRSAMLGTMMNTRGLTELIALNLALDLGVISEALFTALVLMALITTFMAGPLLNLLERGKRTDRDSTVPGAVSA